MADVIDVPAEEPTDYSREQIAIEDSFNELVSVARKRGLAIAPCMGLMYLPSQAVTEKYIEAGRAVLASLRLEKHDTDSANHATGD